MFRPLWAWERVWHLLGFRRRPRRSGRRLRGVYRRPQFEALEPRLALTGDLVAAADTYRTALGDTLQVGAAEGLLANDSFDAATSSPTIELLAAPSGALTLHADGSFSYTPPPNFFGEDGFTYRLNDQGTTSDEATVSILVGLQFSVAPAVAVEGSGSLTFRVTLDTPVAGTVTTPWSLEDGSATWQQDYFLGTWIEDQWVEGYTDPETGAWVDGYTIPGYWLDTGSRTGALTFEPGAPTQTITVVLVDDASHEGHEQFYLRLELAANPQPFAATVLNDDPTALVFLSGLVSEASRTLQLTFGLSQPSPWPVSFQWAPVPGTATAGLDYAALGPQTMTIPTYQSSWTVSVPDFALDDALNEGPETVGIVVTQVVGAVPPPAAFLTLADDDRPTLAVGNPTAMETAGTLRFVATLSRPTNVPVSFRWSTADGTARAGSDYQAVTDRLVTLAAGQTQAFLDVALVDNLLYEPTESFALVLSELTNVAPGGVPTHGHITDNEPLPFVAIGNTVVNEGAGTATLLVTLAQAAEHDIRVRWLPREGTALRHTAEQSGDWEHGSWVETDWVPEEYDEWGNLIAGGYWGTRYWDEGGTLVFGPGETVRSLQIAIVDDATEELDESFDVELVESPQAPIALATGRVVIWDNERPRVGLDDAALSEALGTGTLLVHVSHASALPISVDWAAQSGTAQAGLDWTFGYWDGGYYEEGYWFPEQLGPHGSWVQEHWVPLAAFDPSTTLVYVRQDRWIAPFWVDINHWGQLQFDPGETQKVLTVRIVDDALDEADETFTVGLANATNAYQQSEPATVTIIDNDLPPRLYVGDVAVTETVGLARFTVFLTNASGLPVTVQYRTEDLTAVAGMDYAGINPPQTLTFQPGESFRVIEVPIANDHLRQGTRQFRLRLSDPTAATLLDAEALATIHDDDTPTVWVTSLATIEGGLAQFTFSVVGSLSEPITLSYATAHGTALGTASGGDYVPLGPTTLTLSAAEPTRTISVQTRQDAISEFPEHFWLNVSAPTNAYLATPAVLGGILDDDPLPRLALSDVVVDESTGFAQVTVLADRASERGASVRWETRDGSAHFGVDYSHSNASWAPPQVDEWGQEIAPGYWYAYGWVYPGQTITLTLIDDELPEQFETFSLLLVNVQQAELDRGAATVTIAANDLPTFSTSPSAAEEGSEFLSFGVYLDRPAEAAIGVHWTLSSATAQHGVDWVYGQWVDGVWHDDWTTTSGFLEFPYGHQAGAITVRLLGDALDEADETLRFVIGPPSFGLLGAAEAVGTIVDDDLPPELSIADATVLEAQGYVDLAITLSAPSGRPIELDGQAFETSPVSATLGLDFLNPAQRRVTFLPGQQSQTLRVPLVNDAASEPAERFQVALTPVNPATVQVADGLALVTIAAHQGAANAPPTLTVPGPQTLAEDSSLAFGPATGNRLAVADPDAGLLALAVQLAVAQGRLSLAETNELTVTDGDGTDGTLAFRGSLAAIDAALARLTYAPRDDFAGLDTLAVEVNDLGNTGSGGPRVAQTSVPLQVTSVNDAPRFTAPSSLAVVATAGPQQLANWASQIHAGPANEAHQLLSFEVLTARPDLFSVQPTLTSSGTLAFTPSGQIGVAQVWIQLLDDGGAADGGVDYSPWHLLTLALTDVAGGTNEPPPPPPPRIGFTETLVQLAEDDPTGKAVFQVALDQAPTSTVTVGWATLAGSAYAGIQFTAASGQLTFLPGGPLVQSIEIGVLNDPLDRALDDSLTEREFQVVLFEPSGADLATAVEATGRIREDDVSVAVDGGSATEGDNAFVEFTISLSRPATRSLTVSYSTAAGSALPGNDFTSAAGQAQFDVGQQTATVRIAVANPSPGRPTIPTVGQRLQGEQTETFRLNLTGASDGAMIVVPYAIGTINEDAEDWVEYVLDHYEWGWVPVWHDPAHYPEGTVILLNPNRYDPPTFVVPANWTGAFFDVWGVIREVYAWRPYDPPQAEQLGFAFVTAVDTEPLRETTDGQPSTARFRIVGSPGHDEQNQPVPITVHWQTFGRTARATDGDYQLNQGSRVFDTFGTHEVLVSLLGDALTEPLESFALVITDVVQAGRSVLANYLDAATRVSNPSLNATTDSNNDRRIDAEDDAIEHLADDAHPGRLVLVNDADTDWDLIPDYADGYDLMSLAEDGQASSSFQPLRLSIAQLDLETLIRIEYAASDPLGVTLSEEGEYLLPPGSLRLWRRDGHENRSGQSLALGGDYVTPGTYRLGDLGFAESDESRMLFVEAVRPSAAAADMTVRFTVESGPLEGTEQTVRFTAAQLRILARRYGEAELVETRAFLGSIVPYTANGVVQFLGTYETYIVTLRDPRTNGVSELRLGDHVLPLYREGDVFRTPEFIVPQPGQSFGPNGPIAVPIDDQSPFLQIGSYLRRRSVHVDFAALGTWDADLAKAVADANAAMEREVWVMRPNLPGGERGAYGVELHRRTAALMSTRNDPQWLFDVWVDKRTNQIVHIGVAQPSGHLSADIQQVDAIRLKPGVTRGVGSVLQFGDMEDLYDIKATADGGVSLRQFGSLQAVRNFGRPQGIQEVSIKSVNPPRLHRLGRWIPNAKYVTGVKFWKWAAAIGFAGTALDSAEVYGAVVHEASRPDFELMIADLEQIVRTTENPVQGAAMALVWVQQRVRPYLSHFIKNDVMLGSAVLVIRQKMLYEQLRDIVE